MTSKVINWLRGKLRSGRRPDRGEDGPEDSEFEDDITHLPILPLIRPHILTPSPSSENLTSTGSPFFEKLPRELRRDILLIAFGNGMVHMDLSPLHSVVPQIPGNMRRTHAGISDDNICNDPSRISWDTTAPKPWQWWSSVCHRLMPDYILPDHFFPEYHRRFLREYWSVSEDFCRYGAEHHCQMWPGVHPFKCKIGIMGWLLSCRQAYVEGIEVLYKTNTIHMSGQALILNLPRLLPPQRLSDITSLEIVCPLKIREAEIEAIPEVGLLNNYLDVLGSSLPNLRLLYLALKANGATSRPTNLQRVLNLQGVLEVLDAFIVKTGLEQFIVLLSSCVFRPLEDAIWEDVAAKHRGPSYCPIVGMSWRNIDGSYVLPICGPDLKAFYKKFEVSWPKPPRGDYPTAGADAAGDGYWLAKGENTVYGYPPYHRCAMI